MDKSRNEVFDGSKFWCKHCGDETTAIGYYSETAYGTVRVSSINEDMDAADMDDYDLHDSDNFDIYEFECDQCGHRESSLDKLVTVDTEEVAQIRKALEELEKDMKRKHK
jgi:hypothetical protein